jgi:hypothetical protein
MSRVAATALVLVAAGCSLRAGSPVASSPYCRSGDPLADVYHPSRLHVRSRCAIAVGVVDKVKFEDFDGDVHIDLRLDRGYESLLSHGNEQVGGDLVVEVIPQDRSRVAIPAIGERVEVVGPWVDDTTHDWREIHPAWWVSRGTIEPASASELRRVRLLLAGVENAETGRAED